jgi:hypothetical protein
LEDYLSLELSLISFLRDDSIRNIFGRYITPDIVVEDLSRILLDSLKSADSSDLSLILVELKKRLDERELIADIMDIVSKVDVPVKLSNIDRVNKELESYIRWRKTTTQINYMASQNLDTIVPVSARDKESYLKLSEAINFSVCLDDLENTFNFANPEDYERAKLQSFPDGRALKSRFNFVNGALQSSGYTVGELTMFTAPTGVGKSTALVGEGVSFVNQGFKVLHYVLGDLRAIDINQKYIANSMKRSVNSVVYDNDALMKLDSVIDMFSNVTFRRKDGNDFDVEELCNDALRMKDQFDYDALIIDYDANIRSSSNKSSDSNMYEEGGHVYSELRKLTTKLKCTGLIGCQPKVATWKEEVIGLEAASESSKKQHHIDTMITMPKPNKSVPVGVMNLAKARRGETGKRNCVCYLTNCASILEVSLDEYDMIKSWYKDSENGENLMHQWARDTKGFNLPVR